MLMIALFLSMSYMETDAITPKIVGSTMFRVGSGVQMDAATTNKVGTCSASWERHNL